MISTLRSFMRYYNRVTRQNKQDYVLDRAPALVQRFLGHRQGPVKQPPLIVREISILISTFAAMVLTMLIFVYDSKLKYWHAPALLPSFGAAAVLLYNATAAPLAQPRNFLLGTFLSALVGMCVAKLFLLNPADEKHMWVSGALATAISSVVMDVTGTTHPPGGAAALVPSISVEVQEMGWKYLPAVIVTLLMYLAVALLFDNVVLRYPQYWWAAKPPIDASFKDDEIKSLGEGSEEPARLVITKDNYEAPDGVVFSHDELKAIEMLQHKMFQVEYNWTVGNVV